MANNYSAYVYKRDLMIFFQLPTKPHAQWYDITWKTYKTLKKIGTLENNSHLNQLIRT